jgi:anoctamin-10
VEIRGDAWSLCRLSQRPFPVGAEDIGTWQTIFDIVVSASIVTNSALIVFTMQLLDQYTPFRQFWIFIGFQWVLFGSVYLVQSVIPDIPPEVELQIERSEYIQAKLIEKTPDEEDQEVDGSSGNRQSYSLEGSIKDEFPASLN